MREKNWSFQQALEMAQSLGYAEADPTFDIEGIDAAHKASIMAAIAFGVRMPFKRAYIEGITQLQSQDIRFAEQLGYRIKLLGIAKQTVDGIELRIHPCLVPAKSIIANVEGAMNAVMVQADAVGTTLYYGKGAGSEPTASAVIADLVDITRLQTADPLNRVPHLAFQPQEMRDIPILSIDQVLTAYYLRLGVADQAGVLASVTGILAEFNISIDAMLQQPSHNKEESTELIILTHQCIESQMNAALEKIQSLSTVIEPVVRIRKEELI
jgi:homoserine dehydrogenase